MVFNTWSFLSYSHINTRSLFQKGADEPKERYDRPTLRSTNASHSGSRLLIANTGHRQVPNIGGVMCLAMHETKLKKNNFLLGSY